MKLICKVTGWIIAALALMMPVGVCKVAERRAKACVRYSESEIDGAASG